MKDYLQSHLRFFALSVLMICFTIPAVTAQTVPSDLMENCKQWKITYPDGVEDKTLCGEANNEYFHLSDAKDAIVFFAPVRSDNGTTPNSDNIRSELRERLPDGSADIYWTTTGTHMLYVKQAITHLPINYPNLVATQIHGNKDDGIDDSMVLRLENQKLFLSFNGGKLRSNVTIKTNYTLGTVHEVIFLVKDGKHYCYYSEDGGLLDKYNNGTANAYLVKADGNDYVMDLNYDETYFKVGNYTQSNANKEGADTDNPNNYGEVYVYDFTVSHGQVDVTDVSLSPSTVDLSIGGTKQLTVTITPATATNLGVTYKSSNTSVASVSASGLVTALSAGTATITVTTDDGAFTDTSAINVVAPATGDNLALQKPITEAGTHDGIYAPTYLVDGSTDASSKWSVSGFPASATIDLEAIYTLGRTELVCHAGRDYQFTISVSDTQNGSYTTIVDRSANTTAGTAENPIVDIFPGVDGRFVKITVTGAATYTGTWMSLVEFRAYAADDTLAIGDDISFNENLISLYPNPAASIVNIRDYNNFNTLTVYDQLGKIVLQQAIESPSVNISNLTPGVYIFKLTGTDKSVNQRIIKI
jgi:hypothetical protein